MAWPDTPASAAAKLQQSLVSMSGTNWTSYAVRGRRYRIDGIVRDFYDGTPGAVGQPTSAFACYAIMHSAKYYRGQAAKARGLARDVSTRYAADTLERMAVDYDDIADDLENGAVDIRHPELMKQPDRKR